MGFICIDGVSLTTPGNTGVWFAVKKNMSDLKLLSICHQIPLSLSLSLTHTHTHTHTLSLSFSLTHTHTLFHTFHSTAVCLFVCSSHFSLSFFYCLFITIFSLSVSSSFCLSLFLVFLSDSLSRSILFPWTFFLSVFFFSCLFLLSVPVSFLCFCQFLFPLSLQTSVSLSIFLCLSVSLSLYLSVSLSLCLFIISCYQLLCCVTLNLANTICITLIIFFLKDLDQCFLFHICDIIIFDFDKNK